MGEEGAPEGLATALPAWWAPPLGRDPWELAHDGSGNVGEGSKDHREPGEAAWRSVVNGGIPLLHPTDTLLNPAAFSVGPTQ